MFHVLTVAGLADEESPPAVPHGPAWYRSGIRRRADHHGDRRTDRHGPGTHRFHIPVTGPVGTSPKPFFRAAVLYFRRFTAVPAQMPPDVFRNVPATHALSRSGHRYNGRGFQ